MQRYAAVAAGFDGGQNFCILISVTLVFVEDQEMRILGCVFLLVLLCGCEAARPQQPAADRYPPQEVRDLLLKLHPTWEAWNGSNVRYEIEFVHRGYLVSDPEIKKTRREPKALTALEGSPDQIKERMDAPWMSPDNWRGIVYLRRVLDPEKEKPGMYNDGTVVIRADCLFYGDKDMLKQINEDLK